MIEDGMYVWREDRLSMFVDRKRRVGPPQECLWLRRSVIELGMDLKIGFSWIERKASNHLRPIHAIYFADPDRLAAIGVMLDSIFDRAQSISTIILRPIKLDAA